MASRKIYDTDVIRIEPADVVIVPEELKPWHRRPGETGKAYSAFQAYCQLGAGRSHALLRHRLGCSMNHIQKFASRWDWKERARHWDGHVADAKLEATRQAEADHAAKWRKRRLESAEDAWETAQAVSRKAREMLNGNLYTQEVDKDGKTVVIEPAKWTMATAGQLLKLAAELRAAALIEATGEEDDGFDPSNATGEEAREYLARAGVRLPGMKALPAPGGD